MRAVFQRLLPGIDRLVLQAQMNGQPYEPAPRLEGHDQNLTPMRSFVGQPCPYCATVMQVNGDRGVTRDHAKPKSRGGLLCERNRVIVCRTCNGDKKDRTLAEWYYALQRGRDRRAILVLAMIESERADDDRGLQAEA